MGTQDKPGPKNWGPEPKAPGFKTLESEHKTLSPRMQNVRSKTPRPTTQDVGPGTPATVT